MVHDYGAAIALGGNVGALEVCNNSTGVVLRGVVVCPGKEPVNEACVNPERDCFAGWSNSVGKPFAGDVQPILSKLWLHSINICYICQPGEP